MKRPTEEINESVTAVRAWIEYLERAIDQASRYADLKDSETDVLDEEGCEALGFDWDPLDTLVDLSQEMREIAKKIPKEKNA